MSVTPHGWHIPGSSMPENYNPETLAVQCGGVKVCVLCEDAMVAWNLEQGRMVLRESRGSRASLKTYTTKTFEATAIQYFPTQQSAMDIRDWTSHFGGDLELFYDSTTLRTHARVILPTSTVGKPQTLKLERGQWLVHIHEDFFVLDDADFKDYYDEVPEAPEERQSNLVDHAKRELQIIGEEPEVVDAYLKIVRIFADMGHSGASAMFAIPVIEHLLSFKPLSELTDDPEEWHYHGEDIWGEKGGIWQNHRHGQAFSKDGGKTYYLLSDNSNAKFQTKMYESKKAKK